MRTNVSRKIFEPIQQEQAIAGLSRLLAVILVLALFTLMNVFLYNYLGLPAGYLLLLILPFIATGLAIWFGARYIDHLYRLGSTREGLRHLMAVLFGISYPNLVVGAEAPMTPETPMIINEPDDEDEEEPSGESDTGVNKTQESSGEKNLLVKIGGPGYVTVQPGYAVILESLFGKVTVRGEGRHFVPPKEWVKQIINLEEREDGIAENQSLSKNGIRVMVRDIRYRYRICSHKPRTRQDPYPYDEQAVLRMVYDRVMLQDGVQDWETSVRQIIQAIIRDYVSLHPADQLATPGIKPGQPSPAGAAASYDPRQEIADFLFSTDAKNRFSECGAELVWFDIGHFTIMNK